jgi:UDP-N-acetylglucosamine--N-acetylmuramyl-(pentapeptide) pyrophosphoryl-undecaprenol N-acetylglucosamine transferase
MTADEKRLTQVRLGLRFCMAGGGTGGHVIPALAVARELRVRGHDVYFVGTERGVENKLVPAEKFPMDYVQLGGLKNVSVMTRVASLLGLIRSTRLQLRRFHEKPPDAIFSMGGYVAGPPVLAGIFLGIPVVVMEPNAVPGFTNRWIARWVARALITFEETAKFFPEGRTEITGLPVREEFFKLRNRTPDDKFTVLVTGGSQGSRTLNNAARKSWGLFKEAGMKVRLIQQTGTAMFEEMKVKWQRAGLDGEISPFIADMPAAFAQADLVVCRSGAGAVAELAAAGKPSVMIPFPFAADQHQLKNAQAFERAGAGRMALDDEWNGERMFNVILEFIRDRDPLAAMGEAARKLAKPGAAKRAADVLEDAAQNKLESPGFFH